LQETALANVNHLLFNCYQIEKYGLNALDVRHELMEMRRSRMGLIQTPEQLCFSYAAIIQGAKQLPLDNMVSN